ncbi:MAG: hypothetical protein STHCBS139747_006454 [Sporothrix thermara]
MSRQHHTAMKAFKLKPAGTGSTTKSYTSHSQSVTSATSTSMSPVASVVSSSLAHAKHATSAAWSACKQGTRTTLQRGSSALHLRQPSPGSRRVGKLFRLGRGKSSRYRSIGEDYFQDNDRISMNNNDDNDDLDIFSGQPFHTSLAATNPFEESEYTSGHQCDMHCDSHSNSDLETGPLAACFMFTHQHAASGYLATSSARHMYSAADDGVSDDDEWWRD